jgi:ankyrin repeat protein
LGADPLLPNKDGCTPLMAAAGVGTLAPTEEAGTEPEALTAVEYLLSLRADVNTVDRNGETAMHGAAYQSRANVVRVLADHGADINVWNKKNKWGWTPLMIAEGLFYANSFKRHPETAALLRRLLEQRGQ